MIITKVFRRSTLNTLIKDTDKFLNSLVDSKCQIISVNYIKEGITPTVVSIVTYSDKKGVK